MGMLAPLWGSAGVSGAAAAGIGSSSAYGAALGTIPGRQYLKKQKRQERRDAAARKEERLQRERAVRNQLRLYHRLKPQGGGPGASVITGAQIRADTQNIRSGATAREVLG